MIAPAISVPGTSRSMVVQCGAATTWRHEVILKYYCCACAPFQYSSPTLHLAHHHTEMQINSKLTKCDDWKRSLVFAIANMQFLLFYYPIYSTINLCYIRSLWRILSGGTGDGDCGKCLCCCRNDSGSMRWSAWWILHQRVASFQWHLSGGDAPFFLQDSRSSQASHENFSFLQPQKSRQILWTHFSGFSLVLWGW